MKRNNAIGDSLRENLSGLRVTPRRRAELMNEIVGGRKTKKKRSVALVLATVLVLMAAVALAYTLARSPRAQAVAAARQALSQGYGLTAETMGLFDTKVEQEGEGWTVTLAAASFPSALLGEYKAAVRDGKGTASWSYDEVDKALWQEGALSAPVWGQPQLEKALRDRASADHYSREAYAAYLAGQDNGLIEPTALPFDPKQLKEGERWWNGDIIREGQPGPGDMPKDEALQLAYQALAEDFGLQSGALADSTVREASFRTRQGENPLWGFGIYTTVDGFPVDYGVMLDARTGEILMTNVITGANE